MTLKNIMQEFTFAALMAGITASVPSSSVKTAYAAAAPKKVFYCAPGDDNAVVGAPRPVMAALPAPAPSVMPVGECTALLELAQETTQAVAAKPATPKAIPAKVESKAAAGSYAAPQDLGNPWKAKKAEPRKKKISVDTVTPLIF